MVVVDHMKYNGQNIGERRLLAKDLSAFIAMCRFPRSSIICCLHKKSMHGMDLKMCGKVKLIKRLGLRA